MSVSGLRSGSMSAFQEFFITTEVIEEVDEEGEASQRPREENPQLLRQQPSLIGQTLESSFDALVLPAGGDYGSGQQSGDSSNGGIVGGPSKSPASTSKFERKGSLLSRLGHSIRKKLRRLSGDAAAEAFETQFASIRKPGNRSRHNSIGDPSVAALADDLAAAGCLIEVPEHSLIEADSPFGSPARRPAHHTQAQQQRRNRSSYRARGESAETDSGISRQFEKTISVDEDTDSWKRSSSGRSKRNSYKRSMTVTALTPSPSGPTTTVTTTAVTTLVDACPAKITPEGTASSSMDAGFVDAQTAANELETLLQSQGLEPVEFSRSTLV